jgi:putative transposase
MKAVAEMIGVSRSNLVKRLQERPKRRIGRPPLPDAELVAQIKSVVTELAGLFAPGRFLFAPTAVSGS